MDSRRRLVPALLLVTSLAACGTPDTPAPPPFDAKAALAASTAGIQAGNYSFRIAMPGDEEASGTVHRPSRSIGIEADMRLDEETIAHNQVRILGPTTYTKMKIGEAELKKYRQQEKVLKASGSKDPRVTEALAGVRKLLDLFGGAYWTQVDTSKFSDPSVMEFYVNTDRPDVSGTAALVGTATTAAGDRTTIKGTLDTTRITGTEEVIRADTFEGMSDAAGRAVPYTATLDSSGRLSRLEMDLPAVGDHPAGRWTVEVTGYGAAEPQRVPPSAEVKATTPEAYESFADE